MSAKIVAPGSADRNFPGAFAAPTGIVIPAAFCLSMLVSGCSFRLPMGPPDASSGDVTGSIAQPQLEHLLDPGDRPFAMAAMAGALDPQGNGTPADWSNPISNNKGSFVQHGKAYPVDDQVCRAFSAVILKKDDTERFLGTACLQKSGSWVISELKSVK